MATHNDHIKWFRDSSPYIDAHRGKTFVVYIGGDSLLDANFPNIISDFALLNALGIRLVLVHGAKPQIDDQLNASGLSPEGSGEPRITTTDLITPIASIIGAIHSGLQAKLSTGTCALAMDRQRHADGSWSSHQPVRRRATAKRLDVRDVA